MKNFRHLFLLFIFAFSAEGAFARQVLVDFRSEESSGFWSPLTDMVRGGRSTAFMALQNDQTGKISGELFLQDGFGFASYRVTPTEKPSWNIQGSNEVAIEAKGDGRSYRILLKDARAYSASEDYSWQFEFTPRASFEQVRIPLDRLRPIFRGRELEDLPPIDLAEILEIGIQINDGIEGPYSIELKSIEAI